MEANDSLVICLKWISFSFWLKGKNKIHHHKCRSNQELSNVSRERFSREWKQMDVAVFFFFPVAMYSGMYKHKQRHTEISQTQSTTESQRQLVVIWPWPERKLGELCEGNVGWKTKYDGNHKRETILSFDFCWFRRTGFYGLFLLINIIKSKKYCLPPKDFLSIEITCWYLSVCWQLGLQKGEMHHI